MDNKGERWVTVAAAAELLGKSDRTIRRWVTDGKIQADRTGPAILVDIGMIAPAQSPTTPNAGALQAELDALRALLAEVRGERDYLRGALASALSPDRQLSDGRPTVDEQAQPGGERRRPWWRRVFDREG